MNTANGNLLNLIEVEHNNNHINTNDIVHQKFEKGPKLTADQLNPVVLPTTAIVTNKTTSSPTSSGLWNGNLEASRNNARRSNNVFLNENFDLLSSNDASLEGLIDVVGVDHHHQSEATLIDFVNENLASDDKKDSEASPNLTATNTASSSHQGKEASSSRQQQLLQASALEDVALEEDSAFFGDDSICNETRGDNKNFDSMDDQITSPDSFGCSRESQPLLGGNDVLDHTVNNFSGTFSATTVMV